VSLPRRRCPAYVAVAVLAALLVPAPADSQAPTLASIMAADNVFTTDTGGAPNVTIVAGGHVNFAYFMGRNNHSVVFTGPLPSICGISTGPPGTSVALPSIPSPAGWEGGCEFESPGTYTFVCGTHSSMTGSVTVVAAGAAQGLAVHAERPHNRLVTRVVLRIVAVPDLVLARVDGAMIVLVVVVRGRWCAAHAHAFGQERPDHRVDSVGVHRAQQTAEGVAMRRGESAGARAATRPQRFQHHVRGLGRPLADRQHRVRPGQHRRSRDRDHRSDRMPYPAAFRGSGTRVNSSSSRPQSAGSTCRSQLVAAAEDNTANMPDWAGNGAPEEVRILDDRHS